MLDINQDTSDNDDINSDNNCGSHHDLNISGALRMAINNEDIDGIMFINVIRVVIGHRILLSQGGKKIQHVVIDEEDIELSEDEEVQGILEQIK